ncbi:hypothetical protein WOLCODRAFT_95105 [Wolfiporia cocos MD-104 SS10]|uniref:Uncharacterized protein n=1 Tax=Wolfiporia cocos (strain MD-104) TaxID=742152 RepID=A0A2H3J9B1_WOLCO|nr:hypothetical protein WOLCODRAFT_95105 [Wolfiporia cocos MD-104 SS10]
MVNVTEHAGFWDVPLIGPLDVPHPPDSQEGTCSRTITYMLDGQVGLATDLALMAQVAGIARERNASFFIDDTRWNRGRWTDHFQDVINLQPGPQPGCKRPSPQELVACPRTARHWVVSSQTAAFHLTDQYIQTLAHSSAHALSRRKAMFDSAQESFKTVIQPNLHSQQLIRAARAEIMSILSLADKDQRTVDQKHEPYISVHILEGNHKHVQSSVDHPPDTIIKKYAKAARETWKRLYPHSPLPVTFASAGPDPAHFPSPPITYVASDSPEALRRFIAAFPSSTAIFSLDLSTNPGLRALAPQHAYDEEMFAKEDREQRVRLTRGTIVDLALASGLWAEEGEVMPGATICTRSSNMCEVAALGFDWNRAFGYHEDNDNLASSQEKRRWVDLEDTGYGAIPQWLGFVLPHHDDL